MPWKISLVVGLPVVAMFVMAGCRRAPAGATSDWPTNRWMVADWPQVAREHSDGLGRLREATQAPFDRNRDGDVDRELRADYQAVVRQHRYAQKDQLWQQVLHRWDMNRDGKLTRREADEVLREYQRARQFPVGSDERKLAMHIVYLRYFDGNRDGLLEDAERAVGWAFESVAGLNRPETNEIRVGVIWE